MSNLLSRDGTAILFEDFFADEYFETLLELIDWQHESIRMFGKTHQVPRLTAYYGELPYKYSGVNHPATPLPSALTDLKRKIEAACDFDFNSVLCNQYRGGSDSMGYHRDNEPEMETACIASASFGQARNFKLRHRETREIVDVLLADRSLLLMLECQEHWEHAIPKTKRQVECRINLTFRRMRKAR